jgi:hypothetical protein
MLLFSHHKLIILLYASKTKSTGVGGGENYSKENVSNKMKFSRFKFACVERM